jgi:LacI family transcriptional regulator
MAITVKDIAALAGTSRGTVDRVLHNRGKVKAELRERILSLVKEKGYVPSKAGRQLARQKRKIKLGIICRCDNQGFWSEVVRGVNRITLLLRDYGIVVLQKYFDLFKPGEQLALIDELADEGIQGLVIVPLNTAEVRDKLLELEARGITIVVINSEIEGYVPYCYIGNDYYQGGRTAAGLFHLFSWGKPQKLTILKGTQYMLSHEQRIKGFLEEMKALKDPYTLVEGFELTLDPGFAYEKTVELLKQNPDITAVYTVAGNVYSVCQAIQSLGRQNKNKIIHIAFDNPPITKPYLLDGSLTAVIGQESYIQGYLSLKILYDYLVLNIEPGRKTILTRNEIFIRQNCGA